MTLTLTVFQNMFISNSSFTVFFCPWNEIFQPIFFSSLSFFWDTQQKCFCFKVLRMETVQRAFGSPKKKNNLSFLYFKSTDSNKQTQAANKCSTFRKKKRANVCEELNIRPNEYPCLPLSWVRKKTIKHAIKSLR